ncbi:MAG TPA: hypothetical protein PLV32_13090, partial [Chitinophagaceae bacterium]|nr:hypothetical protein [Chitinophagaceae bacterium]
MFGIGNYISSTSSPSIGRLVSATPFVLIIVFYSLDMLYKRKLEMRLRKDVYGLMLLFLFSSIVSLFVSLQKGYPNASLYVAISRSLILLAPFHAFLIFLWYNRNSPDDTFVRLSFMGLSFLLLVNLIGFAGGLTNQGHHLEGRLNLPFLGGLY